MQYWEEHLCEPDHMNTLIIKTPSGGRHLVYKYQDGIKSGQLEKDVLIDIMADGKAERLARVIHRNARYRGREHIKHVYHSIYTQLVHHAMTICMTYTFINVGH